MTGSGRGKFLSKMEKGMRRGVRAVARRARPVAARVIDVDLAVHRTRSTLRRAAVRYGGLPHAEGTVDSPTLEVQGEVTQLWRRTMTSRESIVDPAQRGVVTMTTHGDRMRHAWLAIESIARGSVKPGRFILWLDCPPQRLPWRLRRLQRRGLEVRFTAPGLGVHTKYFPYIEGASRFDEPLVTSDDDMIYPSNWLHDLLEGHRRHPNDIVCHRAHVIGVDGERLAPYTTWQPVQTTRASFAHFATSVSGQLIPAVVQEKLRAEGRAFLDRAPKADDVWIYRCAVAVGVRTRQLTTVSQNYPFVPATQHVALNADNVFAGGNDRQLEASLTGEELARVVADARTGGVDGD